MTKLTYTQAIRYLCGDKTVGDTREGEDRRDEARGVITDAVWVLATEEGDDGKNELWSWIAEGDWSPADLDRLEAFSPAVLAAEWDQYQRDARAAMEGSSVKTPRRRRHQRDARAAMEE